jgi:glyoxylase-like metal-dependent hydrolase (beta-lactamase superfamily II)
VLAQTAPEVTLTRLECGSSPPPIDVNTRFSDTFAFTGLKLTFVYSCYLIKHGDDYMMWDTGQAMSAGAVAPKVSVVDLLAQVNVKPEQIKYVGISHYHSDHIGQANSFPKSTMLIGDRDWDVLTNPKPPMGVNPSLVSNWISGGGAVETLPLDKDVFGDGTVLILSTPGHTPGHHSLMIRLPQTGTVILSGDMAHFHENYAENGVPSFNTSRAQSLASIDRVRRLTANLNGKLIIQHDARDVGKLPAFPEAAK